MMMKRVVLSVVLVASLGLAVAAQGSHVWSAIMTAGVSTTEEGFVGYAADPETQEGFGSLTNPTFIHAGRTYTVNYLYQSYSRVGSVGNQSDLQELILEFRPGMDANAVQALTLTVGDDTFDVTSSSFNAVSERTTIYWDYRRLNITPDVWQAGQTLAVGLRPTTPTTPTPTPALPLAGVGILTLLLAAGARRRASR